MSSRPLPAPNPASAAIISFLMIAVPVLLVAICTVAGLQLIELSQSSRAILLFALLLALMATGMPISIAL
jgi:C4-dicarboxylate transporter DctM subunit